MWEKSRDEWKCLKSNSVLSRPLSPFNTSDVLPDGSVGMEDLQKISFVRQAKSNGGYALWMLERDKIGWGGLVE